MTYAQLQALTTYFKGILCTVYVSGYGKTHAQFWGRIDGTGSAEVDGKDKDHLLLLHPHASVQTWVPIDDIISFDIELEEA